MASNIDPTFSKAAPKRQPRERDIERQFCDWCKSRGWATIKTTPMGTQGYPDRQILFGNGLVAWLELKRPGGRPTPLQTKRIKILLSMGYLAGWADSLPGAKLFAELAYATLTHPDVDSARVSKDCHKFYSQPDDVEPKPRGRGRRVARPRDGEDGLPAAVDL